MEGDNNNRVNAPQGEEGASSVPQNQVFYEKIFTFSKTYVLNPFLLTVMNRTLKFLSSTWLTIWISADCQGRIDTSAFFRKTLTFILHQTSSSAAENVSRTQSGGCSYLSRSGTNLLQSQKSIAWHHFLLGQNGILRQAAHLQRISGHHEKLQSAVVRTWKIILK